MFKKTSLLSLALLTVSSVSAQAANQVSVTQTGNAEIHNLLNIAQAGTNESVNFTMNRANHIVTSAQSGDANRELALLSGNAQTINFKQSGDHNSVEATLAGASNRLTTTQSGSVNRIFADISGSVNSANFSQTGAGNTITATIGGASNSVSIIQNGTNNVAIARAN